MESKLYNQDCLEVLKSLESESVDCVVTDPPYRVTSRGSGGTMSGYWTEKQAQKGKVFEHNDIGIEDYLPEFYRVLKDGTHCYIMCNNSNLPHFIDVINKSQFDFIKCLIWDKGNKICGRYYMNSYEYIIMLRRGKARDINNCGCGDILSFPNVKMKGVDGKNIHNSEKPIALMQCLIENSTNPNDIVLEPFMGSGSTIIAAIRANRRYIGIEIDESYFSLAQRRVADEQRSLTLF